MTEPGAAPLPFVLSGDGPLVGSVDPAEIRKLLDEHGAVLLRGHRAGGVDGLHHFVEVFSGSGPLAYSERSSPRSEIGGRVYTSTDYPPAEEIFLHNENSYQAIWPMTLFFLCLTAPHTQGSTTLADVRRVHRSIDPDVRAEFEQRRWMVVRNFHPRFGVPWPEVFGTSDRAEVDRYCRERDITTHWSGDALRTSAVRDAVHRHPRTGETVWFNHATFFHHTTLAEEVREGLLSVFEEDELPTNTYYGDGGRIPDAVMAHLRDRYRAASTRFDWREDDVLVVDNMLAAHGREPFTGPRRIAVAMAEPHPGPAADAPKESDDHR